MPAMCPEVMAKVAGMNGLRPEAAAFGVSGYVICRDTEAEASAELERILDVEEPYASYQDFIEAGQAGVAGGSLEEYSVSNPGLAPP